MTNLTEFKENLRKLARSSLRLQIFQHQHFSSDIAPLLAFEKNYYETLLEKVFQDFSKTYSQISLEKTEQIIDFIKKIFEHELKRRIRLHEKNINFHCPDCIYLDDTNDSFRCTKGVNPAKVRECIYFDREDSQGWMMYVNNERERLEILRNTLDQENYLFDFERLRKSLSV